MFPLDLPSNWISLHPGLKKKVVDSIYKKRKKQTEIFTEKLIKGKKVYTALKDLFQDIIISPVSVGYYFAGRFFFAKSFIASKDCNNCGLCIKLCPVQAIKSVHNHPYWTHRCESCMKCMNNCPKRAIETAHGFIAAVLILFYSVVLYFFNTYIPLKEIIGSGFLNGYIGIIIPVINTLMFLFLLFISYYIMHLLLRFSFFEKIVVFTSLTKYKFWRRYKSPKF
jgi:ferredoxin